MFQGSDAPSPALIDTCVHCGFCLPTCPTYLLWGEEMDSPRGRIYLMKAGVEGRAEMSPSYVQHFDACLGCLACVTACPSGVQYAPLIEKTRAQIEQHHERGAGDRLFRSTLMSLVPYPGRMRIALAPLALWGSLRTMFGASTKVDPPYDRRGSREDRHETRDAGRGMPSRPAFFSRIRAALALAPPVTLRSLFATTPEHSAARGTARMKVAVLTGCVQRLAFDHVNSATVRVLTAEGCNVEAPGAQGCCGALPLHAGYIEQARDLARHNIEVFERAGVDRVVVNAAGCGSAMKEYGELLANDPAWATRAHDLSAKVRDVNELLVELGEPRATRHPIAARVAYHDACHLAHGQGIRAQPRALLQAIPGVELVTAAESDICCGSAGIYNLVQPEPAAQLGARKAKHIAALSPDMIATANPGCTLQIAVAGREIGYNWPIFHPIELIDASIRGIDPRGSG
jgi:glycolate oxidase iron-sulfur subunit